MAAETTGSTHESDDGRTAVVLVHGMGERRPMDTLVDFVRTALRPRGNRDDPKWDYYYPRPAVITDTYEARRVTAHPLGAAEQPEREAEIFEYHWSFLMTATRSAGAMAMALRILLRRPSNVPDPLFGIWRRVWRVVIAILLTVPALFVVGYLLDTDVPHWIVGLIGSAVILIFWFGLFRMFGRLLVNRATSSLVDVARYLDNTPQSYESRRAIRKGLVDLFRALHDGRYSRILVVAHGVGTYIAYDALMAFWSEIYEQDADAQRRAWRTTDFITVGSPLALADLLVTRPGLVSGFKKSDPSLRRQVFDELVQRGALLSCPPRPDTLPVEKVESSQASDEVLDSQSLFAVTRWTNLWFPVIRGELRGDWFGGALRPLFGQGIQDIAVQGNTPERLRRGSAHTEYFAHPEKGDEGDIAWHMRKALGLQTRTDSTAVLH
jgi:hypothetical protein